MFKNKIVSLPLCAASLLFVSSNATAFEAGDIIIRAGVANVTPDESSSEVGINGVAIAGTGVDVDFNTQLGAVGTYMLTDQWGVSVLASSPFKHDIGGNDELGINDIGSVKQLPPTVTLDYFPLNSKSAWQPYIGVGLNYTIFYSEGTSTELDTALNDSDARLDLTNSLGIAVRAGLDYKINDRWGLNATAYWIDIDTEATIVSSAATVDVDVEIDPFVYLLGISYKF